jgi:hypothetical protein
MPRDGRAAAPGANSGHHDAHGLGTSQTLTTEDGDLSLGA